MPTLRGSPNPAASRDARDSPNTMIMKPLRGLYNWTMAKASHPHAVWWLALFSFVESSFFPIPPHPLLGLMCLAEPKKAVKFALVCTLLSLIHI